MTDQQSSHTTGFFSGLVFGAVAGVAGYYFFGTPQGKRARHTLAKQWDEAKVSLYEEGVIKDPDLSLPEVLSQTLQQITEPKKRSAAHTIQRSDMPRPTRKKTEKKFKGV